MASSEESVKFSIDLVEKSCMSHLFRHASEITRETKGGYLEGKIIIPASIKLPVYIRLCLIPTNIDAKENPLFIHPNLLHINMKLNKKNRKLNEGELPEDVDWVVMLKIDSDGAVYRVCGVANQISDKRFQHNKESSPQANSQAALNGEQQLLANFRNRIYEQNKVHIGPLALPVGKEVLKPVTKLEIGQNGERIMDMGNRGLMLNVITPLQKFSKGGATISDVLKQRFQDVFQREMSTELLQKTEDVFTKRKEDRVKLQLVRLLAEVFTTDSSLAFVDSTVSDTITNSKSKECGPLQLHDVNPATSCTNGNAKIFVLSFFKLVADVKPAFVIYDPKKKKYVDDEEELRFRINQPNKEDCSVFNQCVLIFTAPEQEWEVIKTIKKLGYELHITAYRPSDGRMSNTSFPFKYRRHLSQNDPDDSDSDTEEEFDNREDPDEDPAAPKSSTQIRRASGKGVVSVASLTLSDGRNEKQVRRHICHICSILGPSDQMAPKSLPLAKPGVHRRKNDILKYNDQKKPSAAKQMAVTEVGGDGGKIVEFKVEPDDLIDAEFEAKRTRVEEIEDGVKIKVEVEDDEDIQEVRLLRATDGHLTMPYPPPLASISTGQIVTSSGNLMPMLVPNNSNVMNQPRTIVIMSNHVQQQQAVNGSGSQSNHEIRPSLMVGNSGFAIQNGTPVMTTNQPNGPKLLRTPSGFIEVKNLPLGHRVMVAAQGSPISLQKSLSDTSTVPRTFNGVTIASGIKRPFPQQGIRILNTSVSNLLAAPQGSSTDSSTAEPPVTSELSPKVVSTSGIQISPALLKTLQTINQTKMVSSEREKLLSAAAGGPKRVQLQK